MNDTTVVQENEENKFSWSGFIVTNSRGVDLL